MESLNVLAKALASAKEIEAPVTMVLMGASDVGHVDQKIDLTPCVGMDEAAAQASALGAETVYCVLHDNLAVPRTDTYARAFYDTGDKKKAIELQKKAVELEDDPKERAGLQETLDRYLAGK